MDITVTNSFHSSKSAQLFVVTYMQYLTCFGKLITPSDPV